MSISVSLSPEEIAIAEEKNESFTGNMARRRSFPAILPTLEMLHHIENLLAAQGIENCVCSVDSNL